MLKPKKDHAAVSARRKVEAVAGGDGKYITEERENRGHNT